LTLPIDSAGNVPLRPIAGYSVATIAGIAVSFSFDFADTPEDLQREQYRSLRFVLTPPQALEIAETLTKVAKRLLDEPLSPAAPLHWPIFPYWAPLQNPPSS